MRLFDRLLTRCRRRPAAVDLSDAARRRLSPACRELSDAEERMARHLGLATVPRLLLIDEESAVILSARDRAVSPRTSPR